MSTQSTNTTQLSKQKELFGHPVGLFILFFTELWERFSYYGMRAILVLFMAKGISEQGEAFSGLGWTESDALSLYGWYTMLVYVASIPGGILADKLFGQKKMVMIGGLLLVAGHGIMAIPGVYTFYAALALIILGVGCLKPNISTMVGGLYKEGDPRRDKGFTIFYIGINVGAFLSAIIVSEVAAAYGWHYGFGLAGIGMLIGQLVYMWGLKYLKGVGEFTGNSQDAKTKEAAKRPLTKNEKDRVVVLLISFLIVIVFWGAFEQAGGLMNLFTESRIDRTFMGFEIAAGSFQSVNALFIMLLGAPIAAYWAIRKKAGKQASSLFKMAMGTIIMGLGFLFMTKAAMDSNVVNGEVLSKASMWLVIGAYLFHTIGELCLSPVALSFITKLAPVKYASIMMGVYFAMTGFGNKLAALLGEAAQDMGEKEIFTSIAVFSVAFGLLLIVFLRKLNALTHGADDDKTPEEAKEAQLTQAELA